jgi:hypothetical protein
LIDQPVHALPLEVWFTQRRKGAKSPRAAMTQALGSGAFQEMMGEAHPASSEGE